MGPLDYAARVGERHRYPWLTFCDASPTPKALRATTQGRLYTLTPPARTQTGAEQGGGVSRPLSGRWQWVPCGLLNEGSPADLKGLTAAEVKGAKVTAWYEETHPDKYTGVPKAIDMPYSGSVLGVHWRDGLSVVFDHTLGADGKPEKIHIANEDDWAWGGRRTKSASWRLDPQIAMVNGREQHVLAMLI
jgi:hypothetical protein